MQYSISYYNFLTFILIQSNLGLFIQLLQTKNAGSEAYPPALPDVAFFSRKIIPKQIKILNSTSKRNSICLGKVVKQAANELRVFL